MEKLKVLKCEYHRNGITGIGFYAMLFSWVEDGRKDYAIATVSSEDLEKKGFFNPETRVIPCTPEGMVDITRTMRGDWFHNDLAEWIRRDQKKRWG